MTELVAAETRAVEDNGVCEPFVVPLARGLEQSSGLIGHERALERGEYLFRQGDRKSAVYRLDAGILCVTARRPSGPPEVVEMLFPGSLLGFGFLERHIDNAMAVVASRVTMFAASDAAALCATSAEARDRQATLTEREFAARRRELVPGTADPSLARVAAFLSALYHMNRQEGRNPDQVGEFLKTGDVAAFLNMEVGTLAAALAELKVRGLIDRAAEGGLVLLDPQGLERLID